MRVGMKSAGSRVVLGVFAMLICGHAAAEPSGSGPLKVFILAGQSNMEGHAASGTLDYLGEDPKYGKLLEKIKNPDGSLVVRDDVWIWYLGRKGNLGVGFGVSPDEKVMAKTTFGEKTVEEINLGKRFGPELPFGIVVGDHFQEQVLLIKTAWGGHSLFQKFRPPSSGGEVGPSYTKMIEHVRDVTKNLKTLFPNYDEAEGYEITGFLWFQGYNDQWGTAPAEYEENMANLIKDLRKEFKAPNMPVVIGALSAGGQKGPVAVAQEAAANRPEFKGTTRFVETAQHWDKKAQELLPLWNTAERAKFYRIASERPYHYLGSGKIMFLMGHDFGEAMVELLKK